MTCDEVRPARDGYLYNELQAAERTQFERHLGDCPDCRRELETEQRFVRSLTRRMREFSEDVSR